MTPEQKAAMIQAAKTTRDICAQNDCPGCPMDENCDLWPLPNKWKFEGDTEDAQA